MPQGKKTKLSGFILFVGDEMEPEFTMQYAHLFAARAACTVLRIMENKALRCRQSKSLAERVPTDKGACFFEIPADFLHVVLYKHRWRSKVCVLSHAWLQEKLAKI